MKRIIEVPPLHDSKGEFIKDEPIYKTVTTMDKASETEPTEIIHKKMIRLEETPNGVQKAEVIKENGAVKNTKTFLEENHNPLGTVTEIVEEEVVLDPRSQRLPPRRRARTPSGGNYGDRRRSRPDPRRRDDAYGYERDRYARRRSRGPSGRSSRGPGYGRYGRRY